MSWLIFQLICFFYGIGFSTGGGNFPGQESSNFIYLKAALIFVPIAGFGVRLLLQPVSSTDEIIKFFRSNRFLVLYLLCCLVVMPFAVNVHYSLIRYSYMLFEFISLACLLAQFRFIEDNKAIEKSITALSFASFLLPIYVILTNGFVGFRFGVQSLNLIHPNILATFYALLILWYVTKLIYGQGRLLSVFIIVILSMIEIMLFSRTALLGLLLSLLSLPFISLINRKSRNALIGCLVVLFGIILFMSVCLLGLLEPEKVLSLFVRGDSVSSMLTMTNRTLLWKELLSEISLKVFLSGYGYSVISKGYGIDLGTGILYGAHNAFLSVLLGSGIFALLCIVVYFIRNAFFIIANRYYLAGNLLHYFLFANLIFLITCFASEEVGVTLTINFSFIILVTNMLFLLIKRNRT